MASMTPLQIVKKEYGSKDKLVDKLLSSLGKKEGEAKDIFKKRIMKVSSRKLLRLAKRSASADSKTKKKKTG